MVQVIEQEDFGSKLGQSLGAGTLAPLQMLMQSKMKRMQQREKLKDFYDLSKKLNGEGGILDTSQKPSHSDISDQEILAASQIDPNLAKLLQSQKEFSFKEASSRFKETKDERKEILSQARAAKENNLRLDRMEELNKSGKLVSGLYNDMLKRLGIDYASLKNPESQEFEKLSIDMLRNAKEIFGNRVSNFEVSTFLKSIPNLSQTPEGRERVIRNLKLLNQGSELRAQALKDILKENKGVPPYDISEQVEERISPHLDQISEEFVVSPLDTRKSFESLPSPSEFSGKIIRDTISGKRFQSDGTKWKVVK